MVLFALIFILFFVNLKQHIWFIWNDYDAIFNLCLCYILNLCLCYILNLCLCYILNLCLCYILIPNWHKFNMKNNFLWLICSTHWAIVSSVIYFFMIGYYSKMVWGGIVCLEIGQTQTTIQNTIHINCGPPHSTPWLFSFKSHRM